MTAMTAMMPVLFQAHGAPPLLDDPRWIEELAAWAKALPRPKAIVVVSAHWEQRPLSIGAIKPVPLIYDFYGFPEKFYRLQYPAPGAPDVAQRIAGLMAGAKIACIDEPTRGLDHGSYIPLMCMYPEADIPVLQLDAYVQARNAVIARHDIDALLDYRRRAPGVRESLPTHEHFVPVIVAAGAAGEHPVTFPITGFWFGGPMTRRSVQFG